MYSTLISLDAQHFGESELLGCGLHPYPKSCECYWTSWDHLWTFLILTWLKEHYWWSSWKYLGLECCAEEFLLTCLVGKMIHLQPPQSCFVVNVIPTSGVGVKGAALVWFPLIPLNSGYLMSYLIKWCHDVRESYSHFNSELQIFCPCLDHVMRSVAGGSQKWVNFHLVSEYDELEM